VTGKELLVMKFSITVVAIALALGGCGDNAPVQAVCGDLVCDATETAATCAEDCGCGNGVVNAGESCDGAALGDATCMSVVQRGGTLACNADCTFDVTGCDEYACGDAVADPGEACDGADLAGATCATVGFSGGGLTCDDSCNLVTTGCCNDFCAGADTSVCAGDTVETCTLQPSGCLGLEITDCALADDVCDDSGGTAVCVCVDRCPSEGAARCAAAVAETCVLAADGCLAWSPVADCATTSQACAIGPQGATCVADATGEDCLDPYPITGGENVIGWSALNADYLTFHPSCSAGTLTGPDLVLSYTATVDGIATFSHDKPSGARQTIVVSAAACGTFIPEIACTSESTPTTQGDTFAVTAGTTYYFYVRDTTTGTATLASPLVLDLTEVACAAFTNGASNLSPANGAVLATTNPILSVDLDHPVNTTTGVITITGDLGTNRSYDLATAPTQVTFANNGRTIQIDPAVSFLFGETITVSWSGLVDEFCAAPIAPPTWTFEILTPSCAPGTGGMVGSTVTRVATGVSSVTENYVAADESPTGYVYFGGSTDLYRLPKAGGTVEDVVTLSGITSTPLGNGMGVVGGRIFVVDTSVTTTTPFVTRLSTSGGVTWNPLAYAAWPTAPGDDARGFYHDNGRIYFVTDEITAGVDTQIWSISATAVALPTPAVLEGSFAGEGDCDSITGDDTYFYIGCADEERLVRVHRTTFAVELVTTAINLSTSNNMLHAHDFDGNGAADALYVKTDDERVYYVCHPGGGAPFWADILADWGGVTTSNLGLGFDPVANVLWSFDDDTRELIRIE
jgi:hypothetical protein